jgi:hypothetical protein
MIVIEYNDYLLRLFFKTNSSLLILVKKDENIEYKELRNFCECVKSNLENKNTKCHDLTKIS